MKVYYDGLCRVCSAEISHYRRLRGSDRIEFVDITSPGFDAAREGLDPQRVHEVFHVRDETGALHTGVEGFIQIWSKLPALSWLVPVARTWPVSSVLEAGYRLFTKARPYLPRKACEDSPYCDIHAK